MSKTKRREKTMNSICKEVVKKILSICIVAIMLLQITMSTIVMAAAKESYYRIRQYEMPVSMF